MIIGRAVADSCLDNILKLAEALDVTPAELFRPFENGDSM